MVYLVLHFEINHFQELSRNAHGLASLTEQGPKLSTEELAKNLLTIQDTYRVQTLEMGVAAFICLFFLFFGLGQIIIPLVNWQGYMERVLLLKLIDSSLPNESATKPDAPRQSATQAVT